MVAAVQATDCVKVKPQTAECLHKFDLVPFDRKPHTGGTMAVYVGECAHTNREYRCYCAWARTRVWRASCVHARAHAAHELVSARMCARSTQIRRVRA